MKDLGLFDINREVDGMRFHRTEWMASAMIRDFDLIGDRPGWKT